MSVTFELVESESVAVEKAREATDQVGVILLDAQRMSVNADTYPAAGEFLRNVKTLGKQIEAERKALTDPLNAVIKRIMDKFRPATDGLAEAESIVKKKLAAYDTEVERQRQEMERLKRDELRKEEERLRKLAEKAEARGDDAKAGAFAARAEQVALAPVTMDDFPTAPEAAGLSFTTSWSAEVTDLPALLRAVIAGTVPAAAIVPDMKYINATARATKGTMTWPGVRWIATKTARQRV